jgi:long-subunit acyl-CoA synthetase (AMP-forming)
MPVESKDLTLQSLYRWERETPQRVYMTQPMGGGALRELTWAQTADESRRMAAYLKAQGYEPGSRIAILSKNCAHFILSDLAIWMAGYVSVALYPTSSAETIQYILEHSESKMMFVGKLDHFDAKAMVPEGMPCVAYPLAPKNDYRQWDDVVRSTEPIEGSPVRAPEETALLIYTSGSTGKPKGVEHTFGSIVAGPRGAIDVFDITSADRFISYLPLAHVFERAAVEMATILAGARLFFADSLATFVQDVKRAQPTIFHSVPRLWLKFQQGVDAKLPEKTLRVLLRIPLVSAYFKKKILTGLGLNKTRYALSGSAPIPPQLIEWYRALGLELLEGYAMTEEFVCSHVSMPGKSKVGYVGNPMPGVEARISAEGEIQLKTPGLMKGYFKQEEASKEALTEDGWLKTGDRGEIDEQGRLKITGRVKELFKTSKGKYISPAPIENMLNAHPYVEMSCVTGSGYAMAFAFVMLAEGLRKDLASGKADKAEIERQLSELLDKVNKSVEEWERLSSLVIVKDEWTIENNFLTPSMKLKRATVDDTYGPEMDTWAESKIKVAWQAVGAVS